MSDHFDEEPDGDPHGECAMEINRLKAECERLRADAERYRWLRDPDRIVNEGGNFKWSEEAATAREAMLAARAKP